MTSPTASARKIIPRVLPFSLFMIFIAADELSGLAASRHLLVLPKTIPLYLYPVKAFSVAVLLFFYRKSYRELSFADLKGLSATAAACAAGLLVFFLWIGMDWTLPGVAAPAGFNPTLLPEGPVRLLMILSRVAGAVLVVPLMEELFWRSFLIRYVIDADFDAVPIGAFTATSFLATVLLFGLEHYFVAAGMVAGAVYNLIFYKTRSIAQCVLAHAVTNLALAAYVLHTGKWYFW